MNLVTLFVAILLAVMFFIALSTNVATAWFTWVVLAAAVLLFIAAFRTTGRRATRAV